MGNCYGKGSSRRAASTRKNELARSVPKGEHAAHPQDNTEGHRTGSASELAVEEVDGVPVAVSVTVEGPRTPFNTPAMPSVYLETAPDPSTLSQKLADGLSQLPRSFPDTSSLTRIQYAPADQLSKCAYCNNPTGDCYDYFLCSSMSMDLLDTLMENGWWRTGEVIFKPCFPVVCCPGYSLRMPITKFVVNKKHRRIIRKWDSFLRDGDSRWDNRIRNERPANLENPLANIFVDEDKNGHLPVENHSALVRTAVASAAVEEGDSDCSSHIRTDVGAGLEPSSRENTAEESSDVSQSLGQQGRKEKSAVTPGRGADPSKPPCRKAKQMREERKRKRLEARGGHAASPRKNPVVAPSLHELLADHREAEHGYEAGFKHKLKVKLLPCNPRSTELTQTLGKAYELYDKFQEVVHPGKTRFNSANDFKWGFMNSPIRNPPDRLEGSYHMHYYLDDELIMISILDILPKYSVSIYFIYDPAIRFMLPGIYTVLVEIDLVQQLCRERSGLDYFALGYYNPNPKVSYKRQFKPQEVLCNETNVFLPFESVAPKLHMPQQPYVRLADEDVPEKEGRTATLDHLIVNARIYNGMGPVPFRLLDSRTKKLFQKPLRKLISETGSEAARQFMITTHTV